MAIDYVSPEVSQMLPLWQTIDDVKDGYIGITSQTTKYLPQEANEEDSSYKIRLRKATWIDAYNDTIEGVSGLVFKKPIVYQDIPTVMQPIIENADLQGNHLDIIIQRYFEGALNKGIAYIYIDMPNVQQATNNAEEIANNIRPYYTLIEPENITSWQTQTINGQIVLTQVKIREIVNEPDPSNPYATIQVTQYRVLELIDGRLSGRVVRTQNPTSNTNEPVEQTTLEFTSPLDFIPLVPLNLNVEGFLITKPPFYDLAQLNIGHYQIFTDSRHSAHIASVPMLKFLGFQNEEITGAKISANTAIVSQNSESDVSWLDYDGKGVEVNRQLLDKLEMKMAEMGLNIITGEVQKTATEAELQNSKSQAKVNKYVRALTDSIELLLQYTSRMYNNVPDTSRVIIESDILAKPLTPQEVTALLNLYTANGLSLETLWKIIISGRFTLPSDFDEEAERELLNDSGLLNNATAQ